MNPLTNVRNIQKLNERMLEMGVEDSQAWHKQYKDSAYLFIGGLPFDLTEGDIICVFSQYGEIVNINLVREKSTGKSKGFCFLCYEDQRSTVLAVDNLNSIKLGGRIIRVDHCSNYRRPKSDEKDEHGNRKEIIEAGCAPKTPSPSPPPSEDEQGAVELPKKRKKEKKAKKNKKTKEEKSLKKKRLLTGPEGHEEEKQRKPDLPNKASVMERDGARTGNLEKDKNGREKERDVPLDRDVRDYRQGGNTRVDVRDRDNRRDRDSNQRDRDERDDKGDRYQSGSFQRQEHNTGSDRSRDMRGRDRDVRDRERYVDERDVGNMRDQNRGNNYERYEPDSRRDRGETRRDRSSPQRDRTDQDHKSRSGQERDFEKRKERSERQRRDSSERDRAFDRRDRSDYDERKDRRRP